MIFIFLNISALRCGLTTKGFCISDGMGGEGFECCSWQMEALHNGVEDWIHLEFSKNTSLRNVSFLLSLEGFKFHIVWCNRRLTIWDSKDVQV